MIRFGLQIVKIYIWGEFAFNVKSLKNLEWQSFVWGRDWKRLDLAAYPAIEKKEKGDGYSMVRN